MALYLYIVDHQAGGVHEQLYVVDHQGDQEAAVGSSTALSPPIYLVYNDASADVLLFYNTSSIISHSSTRQFLG